MSERTAILMATALLLSAGPLQAQEKQQPHFQFTPHLGMYFPLKAAVDEAAFQGTPLKHRQVGAVVLGGRMAYMATRRWSVEGTFNYSPSFVAVSTDDETFDEDGGVLLTSLRTVYHIGRRTNSETSPEIYLGWGGAVIHRYGDAWNQYTGTTDLAGVVGLGGKVPLGLRTPVNMRFEIENYMSRVQFEAARGSKTRARVNHDTVWSLGFEIPMLGDRQP